jgi:biopolymer transport protein ExbD
MTSNLKTKLAAILLLPTVIGYVGCSSVGPLKLNYYSRNLVVDKDSVLKINNDVIDLDDLRQEMMKRSISQNASIALHVHRDVPPEIFDKIVDRLKAEGFQNLTFDIYRD